MPVVARFHYPGREAFIRSRSQKPTLTSALSSCRGEGCVRVRACVKHTPILEFFTFYTIGGGGPVSPRKSASSFSLEEAVPRALAGIIKATVVESETSEARPPGQAFQSRMGSCPWQAPEKKTAQVPRGTAIPGVRAGWGWGCCILLLRQSLRIWRRSPKGTPGYRERVGQNYWLFQWPQSCPLVPNGKQMEIREVL